MPIIDVDVPEDGDPKAAGNQPSKIIDVTPEYIDVTPDKAPEPPRATEMPSIGVTRERPFSEEYDRDEKVKKSVNLAVRAAAKETIKNQAYALQMRFGKMMQNVQLVGPEHPWSQPTQDWLDSLGTMEVGRRLETAASTKLRSNVAAVNEEIKRDRIDGFLTWDLPSVVGGLAPPLVASMVPGIGPAAAGVTGAMQAGGSGIMDILTESETPVTDEEVLLAGDLNALFGVTSGFVAWRQLGRLGLTKSLSAAYKEQLARAAGKSVAKRAIEFTGRRTASALENALQEVLEQVGGNYVASDVIGYDPTRPLTDQLYDSAKGGATASILLDTLLGGARYANRKLTRDAQGRTKWMQQYATNRQKELAAATDPANFANIQGEYTPLFDTTGDPNAPDYRSLQKAETDVTDPHLEGKGPKPEADIPQVPPKVGMYYEAGPNAINVSHENGGGYIRYKGPNEFWVEFYDKNQNLVSEETFPDIGQAEKAMFNFILDPNRQPIGPKPEKVGWERFSPSELPNPIKSPGVVSDEPLWIEDSSDSKSPTWLLPNYQPDEPADAEIRKVDNGFEATITLGEYDTLDFALKSDNIEDAKKEVIERMKLTFNVNPEQGISLALHAVGTPHTRHTSGIGLGWRGLGHIPRTRDTGFYEQLTDEQLDQMGVAYEYTVDPITGEKIQRFITNLDAGPQKSPYVAETHKLRALLTEHETRLKDIQDKLAAASAKKPVKVETKAQQKAAIAALKAGLALQRKTVAKVKRKIRSVELMKKVLKQSFPVIQRILGPNKKYVFEFSDPDSTGASNGSNYFMDENTVFIEVNLHPDQDTRRGFADAVQTLWHEIGHSVSKTYLRQAIEKVRLENPAGYVALYESLQKEYQSWLHSRLLAPFEQLAFDFAPRVTWAAMEDDPSSIAAGKSRKIGYILDAEEFIADLFSAFVIQGKLNLAPEATGAVQAALKMLKDDYNALSTSPIGSLSGAPSSFGDFIKLLDVKQQQTKWIQDNSSKVLNQQSTAKGMLFPTEVGGKPPLFAVWDWDSFELWNQAKEQYNAYIRLTSNLLDLAARNLHLQELQDYVKNIKDWHALRTGLVKLGDDWSRKFKELGNDQRKKLAKWVFDEDRTEIAWTPKQIQAAGITEDTVAVYKHMRDIFKYALKEARDASESLIRESYVNDPEELKIRLAELDQTFRELESKPYFPHMRYGHWTVIVRDEKGKIIQMTTADTRLGQKIEMSRAKAQFAGQKVSFSQSKLSDTHRALQGMPAFFMKELVKKIPNLTKEQSDILEYMIQEHSPVRGFQQRFLRRRGVEGYSEDLYRGFNSYIMSWSAHVARSKFAPLAQLDINRLSARAEIRRMFPEGDANKLMMIKDHLDRHLDYITSPESEWQALRTFIFFNQLWMNVKSAAVNLSSLPMVTYPYLGKRFGYSEASFAMEWASSQFYTAIRGTNPDPDTAAFVKWGMENGFIDQALMTEAAVAASEYSEHKNPFNPPVKRAIYQMVFAGAVPFQLVEKYNRVVTGLATMKLARNMGVSQTEAFALARKAVEDTQNENAKWNNPEFSRGKKGAFFPFMKYVLHIINKFAFGRDPASMHWWLVMAGMAGVTGLPFAEDLQDILDGILTQYKYRTAKDHPFTDLSYDMHQLVGTMGADPELIMHGLSHESFGLEYVANAVGVPFPSIDMSGSIGMGNVLPGTKTFKALMQSKDMSAAEVIGSLAQESGATASTIMSVIGSLSTDDPSTWARAEMGMPAALRSISTAERIARRQGMYDRAGNLVAPYDSNDPEARLELMLSYLGFRPTEFSQGQELLWWKKLGVGYYTTLSSDLITKHNFARFTNDREGIASTMRAMNTFDSIVPFPELKIGPRRVQAYEEYYKDKMKKKLGVPTNLRTHRLESSFEGAQEPKVEAQQ